MQRRRLYQQRHPETGATQRLARDSLFGLVVLTVVLSAVLEVLINLAWAAAPASLGWWLGLAALLVILVGLAWGALRWDDRRMSRSTVEIEVLLPYEVVNRRASLGVRMSYRLTQDARTLWRARYPTGYPLDAGGAGRPALPHAIIAPHMALLRHLLVLELAKFGQHTRPNQAVHGWLRLDLAPERRAWSALPPLVRENAFAEAQDRARPQVLYLPPGLTLAAYDEGPWLLRLTWAPLDRWWWGRLLGRLLRYRPGGSVGVRWLGPLSAVRAYDKRYEHATARMDPGGDVHVVSTRLVVEVESRWNALAAVARFHDWGLNLAHALQRAMDYWHWRDGFIERTIGDLDWKIGWMTKGDEPGLAARLRRIDGRLARLEAHLWPDDPPEGEGPGAWLSGDDDPPPEGVGP